MNKKGRKFTKEFQTEVSIESLRKNHNIRELATKFEVQPEQIVSWRDEFLHNATAVFRSPLNRQLFDGIREKYKIFKNKQNLNRLNRKKKKIINFQKTRFPIPVLKETPLISIIILNRDGLDHLKNLFGSIRKNTIYSNYEIIVVDNNYSDDSINYMEGLGISILRILKNNFNDTFSKANNKAALQADGELLLFLNNEVQPMHGWLTHLVKSYYNSNPREVGVIGAKLLYPIKEGENSSLNFQHTGVSFKYEEGFIRPVNSDNNEDFYSVDINKDTERVALTAACILIAKSRFREIGGFDENFVYGYEDVDLCLRAFEKGYKNFISSGCALFHYEFGTQNKDIQEVVTSRREKNLKFFRDRWYRYLMTNYWDEALSAPDANLFVNKKLTIGFVVTEEGLRSDYYAASELASQFKSQDYQIKYFTKKSEEWYLIDQEVDILIVMLHYYDISKIMSKNKALIKVAWIRNRVEDFVAEKAFIEYDIVLASSSKASRYVNEITGEFAHYFQVATEVENFSKNNGADKSFECDYCFTGNYRNVSRELTEMIQPSLLPQYRFHLYGKNWKQEEKLQKYHRGFVSYEKMPVIFANTKILIDDADPEAKLWGFLDNSVFNAIMSDVLVISNSESASKDVFQGKLPVYSSGKELMEMVKYYLENTQERLAKIQELRKIVADNHTYKIRAQSFKKIFTEYFSKSIVVKVPAPNKSVANGWGDYHFALALKKNLQQKRYRVLIQFLNDWDDPKGFEYENVLVLRGLRKYEVKSFQRNLMWNISHPNKVELSEYESYDHVFIASKKWSEHVGGNSSASVSCLLQCTDTDLFRKPTMSESISTEILFVGNSRKVYRKIIKDLLPTKHSLSIYGTQWKGIVDDKLIKGKHIPNDELFKYYGGSTILLNDHWEDMIEKGFISNRLFDGLACETLIISDYVEGMEELFNGAVVTYKKPRELKKLVETYLENSDQGNGKIKEARKLIMQHHTFKQRVNEIEKIINTKSAEKAI